MVITLSKKTLKSSKTLVWTTKTEKNAYLKSLIDNSEKSAPKEYDLKLDYEVGDFLSHTQFGLGFIQKTMGKQKISVFFEDYEKVLLQNW